MPSDKSRVFERSHPWIRFVLDLARADYAIWLGLGEAKSKCQHLALVPLQPSVSKELHSVFLAKGVHATTAIEGNTLSEEQVRRRIDGFRELPKSKEYLGQEVDNVVRATNGVIVDVTRDPSAPLTVADIKRYNALILEGLDVGDEVVPGEVRLHEVGVGTYSGAPAQDCEYLLGRMCDWLNEPNLVRNDDLRIPMGVLRAIIAHLYIAWIHPFGDGNGRTARLLEVKILVQAGIPTVAAHLLSNHYNATRTEYYRQLQRASSSGGDVFPFIRYALQGFVDGLLEQLDAVWQQQWRIAFINYIHETLAGDGQTEKRQRHLMLALVDREAPARLSELKLLNMKTLRDYERVGDRTLLRDLSKLEEQGFIKRGPDGVRANKDYIRGFAPVSF